MCSLKREVKVKVTKFCVGREELINVNKLTKFDFCIINSLRETKLNATAKCKLLTPDGQTDRRTDGFHQFIDRTCFAIRSIVVKRLGFETGTNNYTTTAPLLDGKSATLALQAKQQLTTTQPLHLCWMGSLSIFNKRLLKVVWSYWKASSLTSTVRYNRWTLSIICPVFCQWSSCSHLLHVFM